MSHEPGRDQATTNRCEHCGSAFGELFYNEHHDEYWCDSCLDNKAEDTYMRQQERDLESPPESAREEQLRTWKEKQEAHKR